MNRLFVFLVAVVFLFMLGCEFSNPPNGPDIKNSAPKLNITIQEPEGVGSLAKVATCGPKIQTYWEGAPVYLYVMDYQGVLVYDPFYMGQWGGSYNVAQIPFTPGTYKLIATVGGIAAPGILSGAIDGQDYQLFHHIVYDEEFGTAPAGLPVHVITLAKVDGVPTLKQGENTLSQVKKYMIYYFGVSSVTDDLGSYFGSDFSGEPSHPEMKDYWLRPPSQTNPMQFSSNLTDNIYRITGGVGAKVVPMNFSTTFMDSLSAWYMGLYIFERKPGDVSGYYFSFTQVKDPQNPILGFFATGPKKECLSDPNKNKELVTVFDKSTSQNNEHYVLVVGFWDGVNVGDDNRLIYLNVDP